MYVNCGLLHTGSSSQNQKTNILVNTIKVLAKTISEKNVNKKCLEQKYEKHLPVTKTIKLTLKYNIKCTFLHSIDNF